MSAARFLTFFVLAGQLSFGAVARAQDASPCSALDHARVLAFLDAGGNVRIVRTAEEWQRRRAQIVQGMEAAMGKLPDRSHPVPLDVREAARRAEETWTRVEITFAAEPGDRVPAHLYLPNARQPGQRRPAVLALHPTSPLGKSVIAASSPTPNRSYAPELARRGYIVLAPDYPSFGDYPYDFATDAYVSGTMKGIFNHMRCVDLLVARDDVDPQRIGVIGHSLGGHNAMFVAVFDERIRAVVSSCGWTPFHDYYGGKIAGWTSARYMPRIKEVYALDPDRVPFDFYEVLAAIAPRPFFSSSPLHDDNFAVIGVRKGVEEAAKVYRLLGADANLKVVLPDCGHDFPLAVRLEAYAFLDTALKNSAPIPVESPVDSGAGDRP